MHIAHIALQGCLRARRVEFGVTADTGGHIRYLLDLVAALSATRGVTRQTIITRGFAEPALGLSYAAPRERLGDTVEIVRLFGQIPGYLAKEELWRDMPALTEALTGWIEAEGRPDLIHAHYADAGSLADAAKVRFAIPYIFTAHSLGRVKRLNAGSAGRLSGDVARSLARREAVEDLAIASADLIIASSRDEAEGQFGTYPSARPERIRVIAPGCDLAAFDAPVDPALSRDVSARIDAQLDHPARPPVLALARPVRRKNLAGLVTAYAGDPWLRDNANLVIFAGSSHDGPMQSDENRAVLAELKALVASLGVTGRVALPSSHTGDDLPAIYAYARARRGVFANPAYHEPFGLTLIEAAAAGLPVVATDRGGPRDILAECRHGVLVDPCDPAAVAAGLVDVLSPSPRWDQLSRGGRTNVSTYTWTRHAEQYVRAASRIVTGIRPEPDRTGVDHLFLSDIDGTLVGDADGLARLGAWLDAHRRILFGIATGRSFHDAAGILSRAGAPVPAVMITSVGSEIYYTSDPDYGAQRDDGWSEHIGEDWWPEAVVDALAGDPRLAPQPEMEQRPFKRSWFANLTAADVREIEMILDDAALPATVIASHGRFLDILPRRASKGQALTYVRKRFGLSRDAVAAAGDSGNDRDLLTAAGRGIVVANHRPELADLRGPGIVFVRAGHANGILEGLSQWSPRRHPSGEPDASIAARGLTSGGDDERL